MAFFGHFWAKNAVLFGDGGSETLNNLLQNLANPLLPLAVGTAPLAAHQGVVSGAEILPRRPAADGGHPGTDGRNPH